MNLGSWKTSVIGIFAGVAAYFQALGPNLPTTGKEWGAAFFAALLAALGIGSKDSNVSNSPNPTNAQPVK